MKRINFYTITILISILLFVLIFAAIVLNLNSKPRITTIQYISRTNDETSNDLKSIVDAQIRVYFNRPMSQSDLSDSIEITPNNTEFSANWFGNGFVINFKEALSYSQDYTIKIKPELTDTYGEALSSEIEFAFRTKSPTLAYIERTPESEIEKIVKYDLGNDQRIDIFSSKTIKFFRNIGDVFGIVTSNGYKDNLIIYDSKNLTVLKDFNFESNNISDIEVDPYNNRFAIIMQEIEDQGRYFTPLTNTKIYLVSAENFTIEELNPLESAQGFLDIEFNKDYSGIVFKLPDSLYYVADIENLENLSSIGKYLYFGNFNKEGDKTVLLEYDPLASENLYQYIVTIDSEREKEEITKGETPVIDPLYFNKSNSIYFSEFSQELIGTKGIYKLSSIDENGELTGLLQLDNISIENPVSSLDDSLIAAEAFTPEQLMNYEKQRNFGFQTKPYYGEIIFFKLGTAEILKPSLYGVNPLFIE